MNTLGNRFHDMGIILPLHFRIHTTKKTLIAGLAIGMLLAACRPTARNGGTPVVPFDDVRFKTLTNQGLNLGGPTIETLWFNESTTWSPQDGLAARRILEQGKNPGLGVRQLHAKGITGKGVNVAIIDQNIVLDHPEYRDKIVEYYDAGTD